MKTEQRLKELGIELAPASGPLANYVNAVRTGNLLYLAGKGPGLPGQPMPSGKVGRDFTIEQGYEYARQTGLSLIAVMKAELGDLDQVTRSVKGVARTRRRATDQRDKPYVMVAEATPDGARDSVNRKARRQR